MRERVYKDLTLALKARETEKAGVLRMLISSMKNAEIDARGKTLTDADYAAVIKKEVKKRKDAIDAFTQGGRNDLVEKETAELAVLSSYLPEELPDEEVKKAVQEIIAQTGATTAKDMGKVMGLAMQKLKGQVDGSRVKTVVSELLK